jgi:hypothetical protein
MLLAISHLARLSLSEQLSSSPAVRYRSDFSRGDGTFLLDTYIPDICELVEEVELRLRAGVPDTISQYYMLIFFSENFMLRKKELLLLELCTCIYLIYLFTEQETHTVSNINS